MHVTQLALTWVEWPNGEKLALTCVQIQDLDQSERKASQVNATQVTQSLVKRSRKKTQVFNLHVLAHCVWPGLYMYRKYELEQPWCLKFIVL